MSKRKYTWETDKNAEIWRNDRFETIEDCVADALENGVEPGEMIAIGICEDYTPHIDVDAVLERVGEDAYDEVGEAAEDWPAYERGKGYVGADSLEERLNKVFAEWLEETKQMPIFYRVSPMTERVEVISH